MNSFRKIGFVGASMMDSVPAFVDAVAETMIAIGKAPIRVKDVVDFAVNRPPHALVIEPISLVDEGVCSPEDVDAAGYNGRKVRRGWHYDSGGKKR